MGTKQRHHICTVYCNPLLPVSLPICIIFILFYVCKCAHNYTFVSEWTLYVSSALPPRFMPLNSVLLPSILHAIRNDFEATTKSPEMLRVCTLLMEPCIRKQNFNSQNQSARPCNLHRGFAKKKKILCRFPFFLSSKLFVLYV